MSLIEVKDLVYSYDDKKNAVDGVSFAIEKGTYTAVIGHNGSGKSTLAKLLNGLFLPKEGRVLVLGMDTQDEDLTWQIRQNAGLVFQNPDNQLVATIVEEDVAFGPENLGLPTDKIRSRVDAALNAVRMGPFADRAPHMLSGGQKQRIAIAGVIAMLPEVIVFDESTSMLDPSGREDVFNLAKRLNQENNVTVLWITHFMEEAAKCDRVIVMDQGKVMMDGTPREVFSDSEKIEQYGLEAPDMAKLADALRKEGLDLRDGIITVDEMEVELCRLLSKI